MKKLTAILLAFILTCSLVACGAPEASKTPADLIAEGKYFEAYDALLAKGDAESLKELEKFVFLPAQTVEVDEYNDFVYTYDYTWDENGNVLRALATFRERTRESTYSYEGNTVTQTGGSSESRTYDEQGRVVKASKIYGNDTAVYLTDFTYDEQGNLISEIERNTETGEINISRKFAYDAQGRLVEEIWGEGSERTFFSYNELGQMIKEETVLSYVDYTLFTYYTYDEKGQLIQALDEKQEKDGTKEKGTQKVYTYNDQGQLVQMLKTYSDGETVESTWNYDKYGNMTKLTEKNVRTNGDVRIETREHKNFVAFYMPQQSPYMADTVMPTFRPEI